jgi:two-component system NtrC family sensor kinase
MLRRRASDPTDLQALDAIRTAVGRGESLTRQLLAFARRQPLSRVAVDLRERIEAVREMLGSSLRANIRLEYDIPDDVWPVELDLGEFELALVNVVVNARDAMPEGGGIVLSASNVTLDGSSAIDDLTGEFVALAIADSGAGIPRDVLPKVFEPFFTTKAVGKGTGLGLSQVYGFARRSGGTVTIRSDLGRGTVVTLYLPRTHRPVAKLAEGPDAKGVEPAHGTILLVEDNSEVAHVTSALLQQLGYQVARSESADEALTRLENGERFDLVFSDIVMPGEINGLMLAREIGRRYPDLPVLLTSGYSDMVHAAEMEPVMILRKPFDDAALGKAVRDALRAKQKAA